ncbi:unnamed protein product [Medioppia subpectinata]|uniref:Nuclear receptor domain-containing protein n=1 Tax=Medioppia subpectinata TaxID=1979941 RepID=A0A7R9Q052_9ACAR|nr:unnamed protein product [Medioppia subpectinata]CAG2107174.1 unnamed protein product [Medioppia subpectinata]
MCRNFTAITCDSCKSFFRRTALKNKPFKCRFEGTCNITLGSRKSCKKCRFDKCIAVGMKKECLRDEEENQWRRQSANERKLRQQIQEEMIVSTTNYHGLNQLESNRISELFNASRVIDASYPTPKNVVNLTDSKVLLRFSGSIAEDHIKNIVTFLKGINGFKEMCEHDQFAITKSILVPNLQNAIRIQLGLWSEGTYKNVMETNLKSFLARFVSLVQKDVISKLEQQLYIYLLQRYLLLKCWSESEAQTRLQNLINYGSITCKSCRVFFWRAITNNKVLKCPSKGTCSIDKAFRSICPNCRLNKCFTVGMKREYIKSKEQNETNNCQMNATINRKGVDCTDIIAFKNNDNNNNYDKIEDLIRETLNISTDGLVEKMTAIENCLQTNRMDTNNELISINNIYRGKNKCHDSTLMPIIPVLTDHKGWNQMETIKLSELLTSSHVFSYPMADTRHIIRDKNSISDVVKFTRGLNGFTNILAADQYTLIKHGCFELLTLRYLVYYDHRTAVQKYNKRTATTNGNLISSTYKIKMGSSCANLYAFYADVHISVQGALHFGANAIFVTVKVLHRRCAQFRASNSANHTASDSTCNCAHWATGGANRCAYLGTSVAQRRCPTPLSTNT